MGAAAPEFNLETGIRPYQEVGQTNTIWKVSAETE
jgi:hypothetical protein